MTTEVGSGQVAIFPTFKGFRKAVANETDGSAKASASGFSRIWQKASSGIGRSSGQGFARTFNSAVGSVGAAATKKLQAEVAAASRSLSASRLKEQDSAGRVRVAEVALNAARATGAAGSLKVVTAEERLASAQRADAAAKDVAASATTRLTAAQESLAAATASSSRGTLSRLFSGGAGLGASAGRAIGGGFARSFRSALSPIAGLLAGFIGFQLLESGVRRLTGVIRSSLSVMATWQVLNAQSAAFIKSTGGVAGVTAQQVAKLSTTIEGLTGSSRENVQAGANIVGTFKKIRNQAGKNNNIYDQTVLTATNMARALGKDVPSAALQLAKALNDPAVGLSKLQRAGVTFTKQQVDQVKALAASGHLLQAQKIILAEVNSEFGASGAEFRTTIPGAVAVMQGAFAQLGAKLTSGLSPAIVGVINLVTKVVDKFKDSSVANGLITRLDAYVGDLTSKLTSVIGLVETLSGTSKGVTFAGVTSGLEKIFPSLKPILSLFAIASPIIASVVKQLGPQLSSSVTQLLPGIGQLLVAILPVLPPLTSLAVAVIPLLLAALKLIVPVVTFVAANLKNTFGIIGGLIDFLSGKISPKVFLAKFQAIEGGFISIPLAIVGALTNAGKAVIAWFISIDAMIGHGITTVVGFFISLPARIGKAIAGANTWLLDVGKKIIGGLIQGLKDNLGNLGKFLGTIGNFIVQHKGPPSADAVLLKDNGALIMQSLINGLDGKKRDLAKMLGGVQSNLVGAVSPASSGTAASAAGDRPIYADGIGLLGWIREVAGQQAKFIFNTELNAMAVQLNSGGTA